MQSHIVGMIEDLGEGVLQAGAGDPPSREETAIGALDTATGMDFGGMVFGFNREAHSLEYGDILVQLSAETRRQHPLDVLRVSFVTDRTDRHLFIGADLGRTPGSDALFLRPSGKVRPP